MTCLSNIHHALHVMLFDPLLTMRLFVLGDATPLYEIFVATDGQFTVKNYVPLSLVEETGRIAEPVCPSMSLYAILAWIEEFAQKERMSQVCMNKVIRYKDKCLSYTDHCRIGVWEQ